MGSRVTNVKKQITCEQYRAYLEIIQVFGKGMLLQKHLEQLAIVTGIVIDRFEVIKILTKLEEAEIIKKVDWGNKREKFIIFKKYAIRFLAGVDSSQKVAAAPKVNTNVTYQENVYKMEFLLRYIIPIMKKRGISITLNNIVSYIQSQGCNLMLSKNSAGKYYKWITESYRELLNEEMLNYALKKIEFQGQQRLINLGLIEPIQDKDNMLYGESIGTTGDGIYKNRKQKNLLGGDIGSLLRRYVYITKLQYIEEEKSMQAVCVYLDVHNTKSTYKVAQNYTISKNVLESIFNMQINIKFRVVVKDIEDKRELMQDMNKTGINPITKKNREVGYLWECLRANGIESASAETTDIVILELGI